MPPVGIFGAAFDDSAQRVGRTERLVRLTEQFASGEIAFDGYSRAMVRLVSRLATVRGANVELVWGIRDPHDLERAVPKLRLVESVPFLTMPELARRGLEGVFSPALYALLSPLPFYRNLVRHLRYMFGGQEPVAPPRA